MYPLYSVGLLKIWKSLIQMTKDLHCMGLGIVNEKNLDFVNCRYSEHYEQVKNTPNENY